VKKIVVLIFFRLVVALGLLTGGGFRAFGQHVHLFAGAASQQQGSQLIVVNRASYDINSNGGITPECFFMSDGDPLYPNLYSSDATFAALPATLDTGGPAPNCAAQGAYLVAQIISVTGPEGGKIDFWQENVDATATTKVFSIPVGTTNSINRFNISEGVVSPTYGPDPFGHIHGRRFAANIPGLYTVGFQLFDTSTSGFNGGPIHTPSITNYFYFQAGFHANSMLFTTNTATFGFGVRPFKNIDLEICTNLVNPNWIRVVTYIGNAHSHLQHLADPAAVTPSRFYRLREYAQ
jgi:hypothetical protein